MVQLAYNGWNTGAEIMQEMTRKERVLNTLNRLPVDRLACHDSLWPEPRQKYIDEGLLGSDEDVVSHFDTSIRGGGWLNGVADLDFGEKIIEETDETRLVLNGNGATLRWFKTHSGTPEYVDFEVRERAAWEEKIKPVLEVGSGYIVRSDHSIPPQVEYDILKYFFDHGSTIKDWM
jgi:hypothetical protein